VSCVRHRDACDLSPSVCSALQAVANPFDCVSLFQGVQSEPFFLGRVVLLFFEGCLVQLWKNRESNLSKVVWAESCEWSCMSRAACGAVHARSSDECLECEWSPVFPCRVRALQRTCISGRVESVTCLISCARVCSAWVEMKAWHDRICAGSC
jgi:hypothetical protein